MQIPEDLTGVDEAGLTDLESGLISEFDRLVEDDSADLAQLSELADMIDRVRDERTARVEAAEQRAATVADLTARVKVESADEVSDEDAEVVDVVDDAADEVAEQEPELVTAAARPSATEIARRVPAPEIPEKSDPVVTITASADVPGFAGGANLTLTDVAKAMHARARGLPKKSARASVATIQRPIPEERRIPEGASPALVASILDQAGDVRRLRENGALVAAGGWCAPSENLYDLLDIEGSDGILDLPTVQIARGGLNVPSFIGFGDADGALWTWTEADDIAAADPEYAGPYKACLRIPCPDFTDYRLQADGLCLTHGNLSNTAFPELTERFVRLALTSHRYRMSGLQLTALLGTADNIAITGMPSDASGDILYAVELHAANLRSRWRLANSDVVEVALPAWAAPAVRASFAARAGVALTNVSDADLAAHFAVRGVRVQFVHDMDPLVSGGVYATAYPATVQILSWVSGGYVLGTGGSIDLGVVRDSTLNAVNDYTAAWTEEFWTLVQRGPNAVETELPISVDGITACCPPAEIV